jgi:hypothetical protein
MPSEKFFVHKEDGSLVRLKGRLVRFLDEEPPTGSDKSAIRTALEVSPDAEGLVQADVGTAPNEIPVNGMLGDMAYQSSEGISVAKLQGENAGLNASPTDARLTITDATNDCIHLTADESTIQGPYADTQIRMGGNIVVKGVNNAFLTTGSNVGLAVDSSGRVGIGTSSPSHKLTVDSGDIQLQVPSSINTDVQSINWKNTNSSGFDIARIQAATGGNIYEGQIKFLTKDSGGTMATRWTINSSGNLVANGTAIDFGSNANAPGATSELLDDYETGTWSPVFAPQSGSFTSITMVVTSARYTKIGNRVIATCYINTNGLNTSGGSGPVTITGLPFSAIGFNAVAVGYAVNWIGQPAGGYTQDGTSYLILANRSTSISGPVSAGNVSDLNTAAGQQNNVMISVTYTTS